MIGISSYCVRFFSKIVAFNMFSIHCKEDSVIQRCYNFLVLWFLILFLFFLPVLFYQFQLA